jgi:hypothetical protein
MSAEARATVRHDQGSPISATGIVISSASADGQSTANRIATTASGTSTPVTAGAATV